MLKNTNGSLVSHREALELTIEVAKRLLESTRNREAQETIENALMYLGQVRSHLDGDYIQHKDPVLMTTTNGNKVQL